MDDSGQKNVFVFVYSRCDMFYVGEKCRSARATTEI